MPASKKIIVSIPEQLLHDLDKMSAIEDKNRSEVIREAINLYLGERRKQALKEQLRKGYQEMGDINKAIAEENFLVDNETYHKSVEKLAE
ncbi:MAG: CopG family ribbon-helix-helix protein [Candidatus Saccharibacteria bacterium]